MDVGNTLHGDIKPANLLLTKENSLKISDFNLAVPLGTKSHKGTLDYRPPERMKSSNLEVVILLALPSLKPSRLIDFVLFVVLS
jgi:serine/threonine protein kinase